MNVCLLSTEYPPETGWGGIGTHTYELAHGLQRAGARVVVLSRSTEGPTVRDDQGVTVYRVPPPPVLERCGMWRLRRLWNGYNLAAALKLREIAAQHAIQIVEAPEARAEAFFALLMPDRTFPIVVKLHMGTKWVWHLNRRPLRAADKLAAWMERVSVRRADRVVSPSRAMIALNRCPGGYLRDGQEARMLRNPIRSARFRPDESLPLIKSEYVLFVGRVEVNKGAQVLFQAMREVWSSHSHVKLVLVGASGDLAQSLIEALPTSRRANVRYVGFVPREEIASYYQHAAVCCLPSRWENFPYTCLEAMASGAAVVASQNGGMAEMIEDGVSGYLIDPQDIRAIAERVSELIDDRDLRHRMGARARETVRTRFDTAVIVEHTLDLYRDVMADWDGRT